jgi:DNA-binding transcriptional regulator YiaG
MSSSWQEHNEQVEQLLSDVGIVEEVEIESHDGVTRTVRIERNPLELDEALVDRARQQLHVSPEEFARGCVL